MFEIRSEVQGLSSNARASANTLDKYEELWQERRYLREGTDVTQISLRQGAGPEDVNDRNSRSKQSALFVVNGEIESWVPPIDI